MRQYFGGEYYFSPAELFGPVRNDWMSREMAPGRSSVLTRGGYHSILFMLRHLLPADQTILLPSYLCQSILTPFDQMSRRYAFYRIDGCLRADLAHLDALLRKNPTASLLVIDYFGFPPEEAFRELLTRERNAGRTIIQDRSHSSLSTFADYGTIVFNSLRKIGPADGSMLTCDIRCFPGPYPQPTPDWLDRAARIKIAGQLLRWAYCVHGIGQPSAFLERFARNERDYYRPPCGVRAMLGFHRSLFSHLPLDAIRERRRKNYMSLARLLAGSGLLFESLPPDVVPLFFTLRAVARDQLRQRLMAHQIFTAIHWELPTDVNNTAGFEGSHRLAQQIVSVPIDHRIDENGIDHLGNLLAMELKRTA